MKSPAWRLLGERLEGRDVPAAFGTPWPDARHLTVSFVPDGTAVSGAPSALFQTFSAVVPSAVWRAEILRALQTWAAEANITIGLVADGGQPVGAPGAIEGDPRFGDIRVSARPLGPDALAVTAPFDPKGGTLAGDIIFNTTAPWGVGPAAKYDLFTAALHEAGHALGLGDSADPASAMYAGYSGTRTGLSAGDAANVRALYGARAPDRYEGPAGNDALNKAAAITLPDVEGDLTTAGDVDFYKYKLPRGGAADVTFSVQTAGVSLLAPRLTVYDQAKRVVGTAVTTDPLTGGVSVRLAHARPGGTYYLKVEGGRDDVFGVGGYRLKADSGPVSEAQIRNLDAMYSLTSLSAPVDDGHTNDSLAAATNLDGPAYRADPRFNNAIEANVEDARDVDYYKVTSPVGKARAMVVSVAAARDSLLDPVVTVYDPSGKVLPVDVLVNDGGSYLVQLPATAPGATYFIKVDASSNGGARGTGDYLLGVNFRAAPLGLRLLADSTLTDAHRADSMTLTVSETQVTHFVLAAGAVSSSVPTALRMAIFDSDGHLVFILDAAAGQTVSADVYLKQGTYKVAVVAATADHSALPALNYRLWAESLTDPIGPVPIDPTDPPPTQDPDPVVIVPDPTPDPIIIADPVTDPWTPLPLTLT
jgi:hypothetical protein